MEACGIANAIYSNMNSKENLLPSIPKSNTTASFPIFRAKQSDRQVKGTSTGRIINGIESPNMFPWAVVLLKDSLPNCGGSLITREWVLTAGHCLILWVYSHLGIQHWLLSDTVSVQPSGYTALVTTGWHCDCTAVWVYSTGHCLTLWVYSHLGIQHWLLLAGTVSVQLSGCTALVTVLLWMYSCLCIQHWSLSGTASVYPSGCTALVTVSV